MSSIVRLDRRAFMRNAGATAIAGATGGLVGGTSSEAAQSSSSIPRLPNGRYDFDTPYPRKIRGVFRFRYRHKNPHVVQVQC